VWGSEFTTKAGTLQGVQQKALLSYNEIVLLTECVSACLRTLSPVPLSDFCRKHEITENRKGCDGDAAATFARAVAPV
jgi:hypothetical protein